MFCTPLTTSEDQKPAAKQMSSLDEMGPVQNDQRFVAVVLRNEVFVFLFSGIWVVA